MFVSEYLLRFTIVIKYYGLPYYILWFTTLNTTFYYRLLQWIPHFTMVYYAEYHNSLVSQRHSSFPILPWSCHPLRFVVDADLQACRLGTPLRAGLFFVVSDAPVVSVWCTQPRSDLETNSCVFIPCSKWSMNDVLLAQTWANAGVVLL